ncbi:STAS-like domain-containing protein [Halopseudomonas bauzanensis]|uniref:STAS-like domain-containing protein n=1 Tax=Halopseudomonas bauzanensis TaxID=653930 RepID=UPI0025576A10|nr:STAS-like domain-containing protein [Halopseudomonas bauzanensis]
MITIKVLDFTEYPGPRHESIGEFSGERFRDEVLLKAIEVHGIEQIRVDLDGTAGYGSSFLEEAFGGMIRCGIPWKEVVSLCERLISDEDPSLVDEIRSYVDEQGRRGT